MQPKRPPSEDDSRALLLRRADGRNGEVEHDPIPALYWLDSFLLNPK